MNAEQQSSDKLRTLLKQSQKRNQIRKRSVEHIYQSIEKIENLIGEIESEMLDLRAALLHLDE